MEDAFEQVGAGLGVDVGFEDEVAGVDVEFGGWVDGEREGLAGGKVDCAYFHSWDFGNGEAGGDEGLAFDLRGVP